MRARDLWKLVGAVLFVSLAWAGQGAASSLTSLDDVFISGNEKLEFSHFQLVGIDPHDISLEVLEDGLRIYGPVGLSWFGYKAFKVSYKVTARDPAAAISGVSLELESSTSSRGFSKVLAFKSVLGKGDDHPEPMLLKTFDFKDKWVDRFDEEQFDQPRNVAQVWDKVLLFAAGGATTWVSSTNRFSVVPEPATARLLVLGLIAVLVFEGRRR